MLNTSTSKQWMYCFVPDLAAKVNLLPQVCKPDYRFSQVSQSRKVLIVTLTLFMQLFNGRIILRHGFHFCIKLKDRNLKDHLQLKLIYFAVLKL